MMSYVFIGMTAALCAVLYIIGRMVKDDRRAVLSSKIILLAASYAFIAYADWRFAAVLFAVTLSTWFFAEKKYYAVGIAFALAALAFFKYTDFFAGSFARVFGLDYTALKIILPLGLSFYVFSAISYLADVKRKKLDPRGLLDLALYMSFYPKLTSGPIQRADDFFSQADKRLRISADGLSAGVQIFVFGLFKKIVIADRLSVFVDQVYAAPNAFGSFTVLLAVLSYSLQIYFDFSGYSDIAIGAARALGFELPRNFDLPYLAHNVTELWKRWHITLSSWLQDYLYIPLGGSRRGKARTYLNLVLTMVLGGLWHGANLTFIVWGALHGAALAVHKLWMSLTGSREKEHGLASNALSVLTTFLFTSFCWIFFRAGSLSEAWAIVKRLFSFSGGIEHPSLWTFVAFAVLLGGTAAAWLKSKNSQLTGKSKNVSRVHGFYPIFDLNKFWGLVALLVLIGITLGLAYTGGSPFIYGKF